MARCETLSVSLSLVGFLASLAHFLCAIDVNRLVRPFSRLCLLASATLNFCLAACCCYEILCPVLFKLVIAFH